MRQLVWNCRRCGISVDLENSKRGSLHQRLQVSTFLVTSTDMIACLSDDYSDGALSAHESELERMKKFFEDHKDVFRLIDKREKMKSKMIQFEVHIIITHNVFYETDWQIGLELPLLSTTSLTLYSNHIPYGNTIWRKVWPGGNFDVFDGF